MQQTKLALILLFSFFTLHIFAQDQVDSSIAYPELINAYKSLTTQYDKCDLISFGQTDSGKPLHLFLLNNSAEFYPEAFSNKVVILIQNGIHAGEPCGVDASLQWASELLEADSLPENVVIAIIPAYNIGGMLNRGALTRANQNGPIAYGFRGNAQNLDLNRDYIKADSKNAFSFYSLFHWLNPHIFIDTHTSNGADYQYTMTLLESKKEALSDPLANLLTTSLSPYIYSQFDMLVPYVNVFGSKISEGMNAFNDSPRYSTGYAALFNCIGFTTEAHMWKPFYQRVETTKKFLQVVLDYSNQNKEKLMEAKKRADAEKVPAEKALNYRVNKTKSHEIEFKGFAEEVHYSEILGEDLVRYNREKPITLQIPYYAHFDEIDYVKIPKEYIVSGARAEVIHRLKANQIQMNMLEKDTVVTGNMYYISGVKYATAPYEGHYPNRQIEVSDSVMTKQYFTGDYVIPTNQKGWKYVVSVLEPKCEDSFFAWNFFDEILQQKEWYSAYIFEPYAQEMLNSNAELHQAYAHKLSTDENFKSNGQLRLYWLYKQSQFYEAAHRQYGVMRVF